MNVVGDSTVICGRIILLNLNKSHSVLASIVCFRVPHTICVLIVLCCFVFYVLAWQLGEDCVSAPVCNSRFCLPCLRRLMWVSFYTFISNRHRSAVYVVERASDLWWSCVSIILSWFLTLLQASWQCFVFLGSWLPFPSDCESSSWVILQVRRVRW